MLTFYIFEISLVYFLISSIFISTSHKVLIIFRTIYVRDCRRDQRKGMY